MKTTKRNLGKIDGQTVTLIARRDPQPDAIKIGRMTCDLGGNLTPRMARLLPAAYGRSRAADWQDFLRYGTAWGFFK